ncbi:MAG: 50S ribosomal protein L21 [Gammaproteobacteria bacterium]|nr:50S ribosomal protein L21 [Gammaproteobacteria bacterium]
MFAVIETGGKQYRVEEGAKVSVEKLDAEIGTDVEFDRVLMVANGESIEIGTPLVDGAKVTAKVVEQGRHAKIRVIKFKRRKHYLRRAGHRQQFTAVQIVGISH